MIGIPAALASRGCVHCRMVGNSRVAVAGWSYWTAEVSDADSVAAVAEMVGPDGVGGGQRRAMAGATPATALCLAGRLHTHARRPVGRHRLRETPHRSQPRRR